MQKFLSNIKNKNAKVRCISLIFLLTLPIVIFLATDALAITVVETLTVTADSHVFEAFPDHCYGSTTVLYGGIRTDFKRFRMYIRFPVKLKPGATVIYAKLYLYLDYKLSGFTKQRLQVFASASSWKENTIT